MQSIWNALSLAQFENMDLVTNWIHRSSKTSVDLHQDMNRSHLKQSHVIKTKIAGTAESAWHNEKVLEELAKTHHLVVKDVSQSE